jgi:peptidyl-prolyl cis-trans isomerase D
MLQNIREKSQGVVAWTIVSLLIATFALWGVHSYVSSDKNSNALAYVNKKPISQNEVNASYQRLRQQQQLQLGADFSLGQSAEAKLKQQALDQIILSQVLLDAASKSGYRVTTDQVDKALLQIPAFQENGQFSVARFHDILGGILYSQDQFLTDMRSSMLINQVQGGYVNSAFALPAEVNTAIKLVNQKRDINYLILPASRFTKNMNVSQDEVKQYYENHLNDFRSPEQVRLEYLKLSLDDIKSKLHFDQTKLEQYYKNNMSNYTKPAEWHVATILIKDTSQKDKVQGIYDQLKAGANFGKLAQKYSEDSLSRSKGGELEWFSAGTLDPAFEKAVAGLSKIGEISPPIKTAYGYSIIKLLGIKNSTVLPFNQVQSQVENALAQQQAEQMFSDQSDKLSNLSYSNPDSLEVAAKALDLSIQTTELVDREGAKSGITANPRIMNAAFSNDVLHQGNNSDLLQLDANNVVILRVKEYKPASTLPLADVQNTLSTQLRNKKAQLEAQKVGEQMVEKIQKKQLTVNQLSKQLSVSWQEEKNAGRYDSKIDAAILGQAFRMSRPKSTALSIKGMSLPSGDYAIILVNAVNDGVLPSDDNIRQRIFQEEIESNYGHMDYQLYVNALMKKAKIKLNQQPVASNDESQ